MTNKTRLKPRFSSRNCTACWQCVSACPCHAISTVNFFFHRHALPRFSLCVGCMKCTEICPNHCFTRPTK